MVSTTSCSHGLTVEVAAKLVLLSPLSSFLPSTRNERLVEYGRLMVLINFGSLQAKESQKEFGQNEKSKATESSNAKMLTNLEIKRKST